MVLAVCAGLAILGVPARVQAQLDILPDKNAKNGTLRSGESQDVREGDFWVVLNQLPTVEEGKRQCNIEYENPSANWYGARVSLYLKETGRLLGHTKLVSPGQYVETIRLNRKFTTGEYPVMVKLELFEEKTPVGMLSIEIMMRVAGVGGDAE